MLGVSVCLQLVCFALAPLNAAWGSVLLIGLPTLALAVYLVRFHNGELITRLYFGAAFMAYAGLIIHQTNGDIEGHFSAFGLIGMLLYFRDWRTILTATIFIYFHHLILGYAQTLGLAVYVFDTPQFWSLYFIHVGYFLPFIAMMIYISVSLRREGVENQNVIRFANQIARGEIAIEEANNLIDPLTEETGMLRSVTEMSRTLQQARVTAEKANAAKSDFLSAMSHELRTPLNAILGFAQMLQFNPEEPLLSEQKKNVQQLLISGGHLLELINDILELARIEANKVDLTIEDISPSAILHECRGLIAALANQRGIDISSVRIANDTPWIRADSTRFKQVLINLLSNAVKYNRENGTISIRAEETAKNRLRLSVTDSGNGIPEDKRSELFKPFSRIGAENTNIEGTGIGLVISKNLVELMKGSIGLESEVGAGSTFWIELPLANSIRNETGLSANDWSDVAKAKLPSISGTLLYVEDNQENLNLMELMVSRIDGLSLISAKTAEQGIDLAQSENPDLIILDINLSGMSGIEALSRLRSHEKTANIPVFALSASASKQAIEEGLAAGFQQYVTKPFKIREFIEMIERTLDKSPSSKTESKRVPNKSEQ